MRRKLLFTSIALPPKNDPECIQAGRYLYYLQKTGDWQICTLSSASPTLFMPYDDSLEFYTEKINNKIEIKIPENKYVNFLIRKINGSFFDKPDSKMFFHWQWKKVIRAIEKPDIIYSRSFPLSSTIMAYKLQQYYNIPWVMHLSDPWLESPLLHTSKKTLAYHEKWERQSFEKANIISFTTRKAADLYLGKYPSLRYKFKVFPNVFDPTEKATAEIQHSPINGLNTIKIAYTGGLANTRKAEVFLKALEILYDIGHDSLDMLQVTFAGEMDTINGDLFKNSKLPFLSHVGALTSTAANNLQMQSDILLVIDSKIEDEKKNVFFPSKLLDYAIKGKFLLGITAVNSPTDEFIRRNGGISFGFDNPSLIADWIKKILDAKKAPKGAVIVDDYFSAQNQSKKLSELLKTLLA